MLVPNYYENVKDRSGKVKSIHKDLEEKRKIGEKGMKELEREFNKKKQSLGKGAVGKEVLQKQKDLDNQIREHEWNIDGLRKKIESKQRALGKCEDTIEKLGEEKEKVKKQLREYDRDLPGLSLIPSFFRFKRKEKEDARKFRHEQTSSGSQILGNKVSGTTDVVFGTNYVGKAKAGKKEIEKVEERVEEAKEEIEIKRKDKSRLFIKCHKLLLIADKALQNNNIQNAKKLYSKSRNLYTKLEYIEKTEIYDELNGLYNNLSKY